MRFGCLAALGNLRSLYHGQFYGTGLPPRIDIKNPRTNEVMVMSCYGPISLQRRHVTLLPSRRNLWKCLPIILGESGNKLSLAFDPETARDAADFASLEMQTL